MVRTVIGVILLLIGLSSEVGYLWQLARGQAALLWQAKPLERVIKDPDLAPEQRQKLEFVQAVKRFAQKEIGLEASHNYTTFVDIGKGPVSWNLVVCPQNRIEPIQWSYPVVGSVPYRGYFDQDEADKARDKFQAEGYDTYLRPIGAYSTLGWFSDPILSTMLRYSESNLADLIIHELTHATVWIEDDVTFNESLASFVGETGALMWLEKKYGDDAQQVRQFLAEREDGQTFRRFMHALASRLDSLYQLNLPLEHTMVKRQKLFDDAKSEFDILPLKTDLYSRFPQWQLNNARLALYRIYRERTDIFDRVFTACGDDLKQTVMVLSLCAESPEPVVWLEEWLENQKR